MNEVKELVEELRNKKSRDNRNLLDRSADMIERLSKELQCKDTKDCVVEDEAKAIIGDNLPSTLTNMAQYYVIRDKNTGLYFRGKGVNRWGKHYNQASIYRVKGMAENTVKEVSWRGEQAEIVPIQIIETTEDVVPKSEVERIFEELYKSVASKVPIKFRPIFKDDRDYDAGVIDGKRNALFMVLAEIAELKKKYPESEDKV